MKNNNIEKLSGRDFESVDPKILETNPGKEKYLKFIDNPKIPPLVKLFGWHVETTSKSSIEVHKQFRTLMAYVHCDKHSEENNLDINNSLSILINNAKDDCKKNPNKKPSFQKGLIHIQNGQWRLAQLALEDINEFAPIFALRNGDFTAAINCCAENELFDDLEQCRRDFLEQNIHVEKLIHLVAKIKDLALFFQEKIKVNFKLNDFGLIDVVPHTLYLKIARGYENSKDNRIEYEKFLRLAIRSCLSIEEKQHLILELENHINIFVKPVIDIKNHIIEEIKRVYEIFKCKYNELISINRDPLIELFSNCLGDPYNFNNLALLDLLIKKSDQIINNEHIQSRSRFNLLLNSIFIPYDNKPLEEFSAVLELLKGVYFYLSNDFRKATSYFKKNHEIFYNLTLIELKYYEEALAFFATVEQKDFILEYSYVAMNRYDCETESKIPPHCRLREIDNFQMKVIRAHYKAQHLESL